MIELDIELYSSKNSRRIVHTRAGRTLIIKSKKAMEQEEELLELLFINKPKWVEMTKNKTYPLHVVFEITRRTHIRCDFINIIQNLADMMVKADYLPDDDTEHLLPVFKEVKYDKDNPNVKIYLNE